MTDTDTQAINNKRLDLLTDLAAVTQQRFDVINQRLDRIAARLDEIADDDD